MFVSQTVPSPSVSSRRLATFRQLGLPVESRLDLPSPDEELHGEHGEVFTRRWVVELILDLVGYTADRDLGGMTAVEPACGSAAFLGPMVERLLASAHLYDRTLDELGPAIRAYDLLAGNVAASRSAVSQALVADGADPPLAHSLAETWISRADFLVAPSAEESADVVIGNPPYIRLEAVPRERSAAYRRQCLTMGGRADVYVGFYERALLALRPDGVLGFICADRWMRNAYGARLRAMIASGWAIESLVSMTGVDAFEQAVDAYPAITVIRRRRQEGGPLVVEARETFDEDSAARVVRLARTAAGGAPRKHAHFTATRLHHWFDGHKGWPTGSPDRLALIADLEASFPSLEDDETGTRVGIGIATGADKVFIVDDAAQVERERMLPLALARDIASGAVAWSGKYLVNPWDEDGLIDISDWPLTAAYLGAHKEGLAKRHTARRGHWYRTIDRVVDGLREQPKLYFPDFKNTIFPVLDDGTTYPHHNLYWVTSEGWDLRVLGGLLISDIANLFLEAYSVRMRGGFLRFQAQYLRRIRVPRPGDVDAGLADALARAFDQRDRAAATQLAAALYGMHKLPVD